MDSDVPKRLEAENARLRLALQMWVDQGYIDAEGEDCGAAAYSPEAYAVALTALGHVKPDAVEAEHKTEFAWTIEKGPEPKYYAPTEPGEWTKDHLKACRFARKEDAEAVQFRHVLHGHLPEYDTRVSEHGWIANRL